MMFMALDWKPPGDRDTASCARRSCKRASTAGTRLRLSVRQTTHPSSMAQSEKCERLPGTLDVLILNMLAAQRMHGYGIAQHIRRLSQAILL
jgi:hypothetical protein